MQSYCQEKNNNKNSFRYNRAFAPDGARALIIIIIIIPTDTIGPCACRRSGPNKRTSTHMHVVRSACGFCQTHSAVYAVRSNRIFPFLRTSLFESALGKSHKQKELHKTCFTVILNECVYCCGQNMSPPYKDLIQYHCPACILNISHHHLCRIGLYSHCSSLLCDILYH